MALIKMSGVGITELSGKFGGSVGGRNTSGNILRNRVKGTNAKTNKQITRRGVFSGFSALWRGLTAAQRLAWNQAAASGEWPYQNRLGETRQQTGFQLYSRLKNNLDLVEGVIITEPPLKTGSYSRGIATMAIDVSSEEITLTFNGGADGFSTVVFVTTGNSAGRMRPDTFRMIEFGIDLEDPPTVYAAYVAVMGEPTVGTTVTFKLFGINELTGQRIAGGSISAVVAA